MITNKVQYRKEDITSTILPAIYCEKWSKYVIVSFDKLQAYNSLGTNFFRQIFVKKKR